MKRDDNCPWGLGGEGDKGCMVCSLGNPRSPNQAFQAQPLRLRLYADKPSNSRTVTEVKSYLPGNLEEYRR